jgi:tetratricopeptide (TPR) repeat protein
MSGRRKWLFRLTAMVVAPLLFVALFEGGLRLGGYGHSTAFFVGPDGDRIYRTNSKYGWRFFPGAVAREPIPSDMSAKAAGTVRIFVLGSSAARGTPNHSFSFGRILEVMLRERHPDAKFEMINAGMAAINSHVVLDIARNCAAHQPDLFIVYMGNNEVVGPYGPGTVFQRWSPSLKFIRASIWAKSMRIGQLLDDLAQRFRANDGASKSWKGMEMFVGNQVSADDPRLEAVQGNLRQNLIDLCTCGRRAGAAVILSTVAVNLADSPPFASQHRSGLSKEELAEWQSAYEGGANLESRSRWAEALKQYEAAGQIDDRYADLQFRVGTCLALTDHAEEARKRFAMARDLDVLRFRADSKINTIIREVAAEQERLGVRAVDAEKVFAESNLAADGAADRDLFYEHVHLTFEGNYLLAQAMLKEVEAALPQLAQLHVRRVDVSKKRCAELLAFTTWDEYQMAGQMKDMTAEPPFTNQMDHDRRQASVRESVAQLARLASTADVLQKSVATYKAALERTPDDVAMQHRFAKLAMAMNQPVVAIEHLQIVLQQQPDNQVALNDLGSCLSDCGRLDEAVKHLQRALEIDPQLTVAHNNLANALKRQGLLNEAIVHYERALEIDPKMPLVEYNLAQTRVDQNRLDDAIAHYRKAIALSPRFAIAHNALGIALASQGRLAEAIGHFNKALEIDPGFASARSNLQRAKAEQAAPPARDKK